MTAEGRISLVRQYLNGRTNMVGLFLPPHVQTRVRLEETTTGPVLQFSAPLPESLPKPHAGKLQIHLTRYLVRITPINGTLIMHFDGFRFEIPPRENNTKYTRHTSTTRGSADPPEPSYTRARMSAMRR